jgi:hypothetical protein
VVEDAYLAAPDGPIVADVRLQGGWPWLLVALGVAIIVAGGLLL